MNRRSWLTLAAVLLTALLCAAALLLPSPAPVVFPGDRMVVSQGLLNEDNVPCMPAAGDVMKLQPDWPWVDSLSLVVSGPAGHTVTVEAAGVLHELTLTAEPLQAVIPVNGFAPEITLTALQDGGTQVTDCSMVQRRHMPMRWAAVCVLAGTAAALLLLWRRRLAWASFALLLGLGFAMVMGKLAMIPHGWDEYIHRELTETLAGVGAQDIRSYVQSLTLWDVGYLPAAAGIALGNLLGLVPQLTYRLGSLCSAACYAAVCALAVKHAPRYRLSFLMLAAFPVCVYQGGCYTYDGVVIAFALLGTALVLEELSRPGRLTTLRAVALTAPLCLAMLPKPCYSVLLLMLLLLPAGKFASRRQLWLFRGYVILLTLWSLLSAALPGAYDDVIGGDARFESTDSAAQLAFILAHPGEALGILGGYMLREFPKMYLTVPFYLMGSYGGKLAISAVLIAAYLLACPLCLWDERGEPVLTAGRRIALAALALLPMVILTVAQYLVSSAVGSHEILGMQERYTLPVWPLLGLALTPPQAWRIRWRRWGGLLAAGMTVGLAATYLVCIYFTIARVWLL